MAICGTQSAHCRKHQADGCVGNGVVEYVGGVADSDAELACRVDVDRVVAGSLVHDGAEVGQRLHQVRVHTRRPKVDDGGDRRCVLSKKGVSCGIVRQLQRLVFRREGACQRRLNHAYLKNAHNRPCPSRRGDAWAAGVIRCSFSCH